MGFFIETVSVTTCNDLRERDRLKMKLKLKKSLSLKQVRNGLRKEATTLRTNVRVLGKY